MFRVQPFRSLPAVGSLPGAVATGFRRGKRLESEEATRSLPLPVPMTSWTYPRQGEALAALPQEVGDEVA
jgi:hypothetical protein